MPWYNPISYCSVVWGNGDKTLLDKLQKLHSRAARIVAYHSDNSLGWKDLIAQRQIQEALMIFKALNNLVSIPSSVFTERIESGYAIRDCKKLASHQHQEQTI